MGRIIKKHVMAKVLRHFPKTLQKVILSNYSLMGFKKLHKNLTLQLKFPIKKEDGSFLFHEPLFGKNQKEGFFTQYYDEAEVQPEFLTIQDRLSLKTETLWGKLHEKNSVIKKYIPRESIVPLSFLIKNFEGSHLDDSLLLSFKINGEKTDLTGLAINRFHYLPVPGKSKIEISSNHDFVLGSPFERKQQTKHKKRLVLVLFIDGFAAQILKKAKLENLMPCTYTFFKKGSAFNNCYAVSGWTLPNIASMFSGKFPKKHRMFHPHEEIELGKGYPIISDFFRREGYMTLHVEGSWRLTPSYGYCKGFDRTVYKYDLKEKEVISCFIEHLQAFKDRNHFAWLSFTDLHHDIHLLPDINIQVDTPIKFHDYSSTKTKSPLLSTLDEKKVYRYIKKLASMDFNLRIIYDYIEKNYSDDAILVALVSDHGQGYIEDNGRLLSKARTHVPFMLRGGTESFQTDEFISIIDILPTLLHLSNINYDKNSMDGVLPRALKGEGRRYIISETIYPKDTYKATVKWDRYELFLESEELVGEDGSISVGKYDALLIDSSDGKDVSDVKGEILKEYTNILLNHVNLNDK